MPSKKLNAQVQALKNIKERRKRNEKWFTVILVIILVIILIFLSMALAGKFDVTVEQPKKIDDGVEVPQGTVMTPELKNVTIAVMVFVVISLALALFHFVYLFFGLVVTIFLKVAVRIFTGIVFLLLAVLLLVMGNQGNNQVLIIIGVILIGLILVWTVENVFSAVRSGWEESEFREFIDSVKDKARRLKEKVKPKNKENVEDLENDEETYDYTEDLKVAKNV